MRPFGDANQVSIFSLETRPHLSHLIISQFGSSPPMIVQLLLPQPPHTK